MKERTGEGGRTIVLTLSHRVYVLRVEKEERVVRRSFERKVASAKEEEKPFSGFGNEGGRERGKRRKKTLVEDRAQKGEENSLEKRLVRHRATRHSTRKRRWFKREQRSE